MTYKEMTAKVANDLGLPVRLVDRAYKAYWKAVREHVTSQPLGEDLTDDEFKALRPNVNIPSLGKLNVTLERYRNIKKMYKIKSELFSDNATHNQD